jgi:hypothetical protein
MYLVLALVLGVIAFACTVSWNDFKDTVLYGIIAGVLTLGVSWGSLWCNQPVISMAYGVWIKYMLIPAIFVIILRIVAYVRGDAEFSLLSFMPCFVVLLGLIYCLLFSTAIGSSRDMQRMLDLTEMPDSAYCRDMAQIQPESMILVDEELALKYAQAALEQDPATGSICEIRNLSIQNLDGTFNVRLADGTDKILTFHNEQVYVAPLEHRDYFKWKNNRYTPGYILVSAMKQNVVYFVTKVNGDDLQLRYLESACFADYWERYVRHRYSNVKFADCNIELDDNGRPFMIIPIKENMKAYTCPEITRVVTLDIQTGAMKEYSLQDVPAWVDRIYPSYMIEQRISWWGLYQRGWWNAQFAQIGVKSQTPGIEQVYTDGDCYWYTGIQSAGADDGTSGFMLTNTRTGKSKLYQISGVNEEASRQKIRNYRIDAAFIYPSRVLMYNIKNEPTYFATCKAESGEFMGYAFASVKYRDVCGTGRTVNEAYDNYSRALRSSRNEINLDGNVVRDEKELTVSDITKEGDNYYFLFNEEPEKEFRCPIDISIELKWTRVGDTVSVSYDAGESNQITLESFNNQRVRLE